MPAVSPRSKSHWQNALPFWSSLTLALIGVVLVYRVSAPAAGSCVDQVLNTQSGAMISLPLYITPDRAKDTLLMLEHRFTVDSGWQRPTLFLGESAPFHGLQLNSRDLTPEIDLARRDLRDLGPHLYVLPLDALVAGENVLRVKTPISAALGGTRIGTICIGDYGELQQTYRDSWWRQVGIPRLCLALFILLALTTLVLSHLNRGVPSYFWYAACLLLMACRTGYLVATHMPMSPVLWRAASDIATLLLVYATYHLMTLFWGVARNRWGMAWAIGACLFQLSAIVLNWDLEYPRLKMLFWLVTCVVAIFFMLEVSSRVRHAPVVERRSMQWVILFSTACGMLEITTLNLGPQLRLSGIFVTASAAVALMFGFLLIRRALLGTTLLAHATSTLSHDLDRALLAPPEHGASMWNNVSSSIAHSERQQMLMDIDAGFGSRMVMVLEQIRSEHPHSRLSVEIQRALLDLRLMIDAMDDTSLSIRGALATLQQRMQGPLAAAGITSTWDIAGVSDLRVNNRRKLMELFRCLEELLSNVVQHAQATHVLVFGQSNDAQLVLRVEDDGCGFAQAQANGRGLRNVQMRVQMLHGNIIFGSGEHDRGSRVELSVPRI